LALGRTRSLDSLSPLTELLRKHHEKQKVREMAMWGIGEIIGHWVPIDPHHPPPDEVRNAVQAITDALPGLSPSSQCVAVDALRKIRDARASDALFSLFESEDSTFTCPDIELPRKGRPPLQLSQREHIRIWTLRAIALIAKGNTAAQDWLTLRKQETTRFDPDLIRELRNLHAMTRDED